MAGLALKHIGYMLLCMRTTINLDDGLMSELKQIAASTGCTLTSVIHDALRESLSRRRQPRQDRIELPVFRGTGVLPGVDLTDNAALVDIMEGRGGPS